MARLLLALLCGSAAFWAAKASGSPQPRHGKCGEPMRIVNAVPVDTDNMRVRYTCVKGYKRKAGTSSLVVCQKNEMTKTFHWISILSCIRDPSKPEPEHMTEDARKEAETPTPTSQPAPPKTSANSDAVSGDPYRSETTSPPDSSMATTQLRTAGPSPEAPTTTQTPQETVGGVPGTEAENVMPHKEMTTRDSQPKSSKPSFSALLTEMGSTTAVSSRKAPENTTWVSKADIPQGQTGSSHLQAVLPPVVLILLLFAIAGLWYFCRKHGRFRRQRDVVVEEIPVEERSEGRGQVISVGRDMEDAEPVDEETPMRPSDCSTSIG